MDHGIRIFRVDNPHTKPLPFWERLLAEVDRTDPDVIFLAEAFTRPAMMHTLAQIGFHQSYTYFTWRDSAGEIAEYLRELAGRAAAYMRPNFFVNTPDILSEYLHSEKYQYRPRDWDDAQTAAASIAPFLTRLNMIRKAHPALHWLRNLRFHAADQPELLCFSKNSGGAAGGP